MVERQRENEKSFYDQTTRVHLLQCHKLHTQLDLPLYPNAADLLESLLNLLPYQKKKKTICHSFEIEV